MLLMAINEKIKPPLRLTQGGDENNKQQVILIWSKFSAPL